MQEKVVEFLNAYSTANCSCTKGDAFELQDGNRIGCRDGALDGCQPSADCDTAAPDVCPALSCTQGFFLRPEVDADGDGHKDSLSISATFEGVSATITWAP